MVNGHKLPPIFAPSQNAHSPLVSTANYKYWFAFRGCTEDSEEELRFPQVNRMDDLDEAILTQLRRDARAPYTQIAERVGTSETTVRSRVNDLIEDGTIRQFTVRVRGANVRALVEVQVETNVESGAVAHHVHKLDGVEEVWELTGEWDIAALANVDSTEELNRVVDGIRETPNTNQTRTRVILSERYPNGNEGTTP